MLVYHEFSAWKGWSEIANTFTILKPINVEYLLFYVSAKSVLTA